MLTYILKYNEFWQPWFWYKWAQSISVSERLMCQICFCFCFPVVTYNLANVQQIFQFPLWKKKKNQMCTYLFLKDCCKLGYFSFTRLKWKEVAQVLQPPKGSLGDQLHLLPGALLSQYFSFIFLSIEWQRLRSRL